jgi:hypothetical protein
VDCAVRWPKGCRRIAVRHDKLAVSIRAMLKLAILRQ